MPNRNRDQTPTEEQIEQWQARWELFPAKDGHPSLSDQVFQLLTTHQAGETVSARKPDADSDPTPGTGDWYRAFNWPEVERRILAVYELFEARKREWEAKASIPAGSFPFDQQIKGEWKVFGYGYTGLDHDLSLPALDLRGVDWSQQSAPELCLPYAHLDGANLFNAHLHGADLSWAHLHGADLSWAHLDGANLRSAHLDGANLYKAYLNSADLHFAELHSAILFQTSLPGANLHSARLIDADLSNSNLSGADLSEAHLHGAYLRWADIQGAEFANATFGTYAAPTTTASEEQDTGKNQTADPVITRFAGNSYLPDKLSDRIGQWRNARTDSHLRGRIPTPWHLFGSRWAFTSFTGVAVNDDVANLTLAPDLQRYIKDQQYIERLKQKADSNWSRFWLRAWELSSDYGYNVWRVAGWAALVVQLFAIVLGLGEMSWWWTLIGALPAFVIWFWLVYGPTLSLFTNPSHIPREVWRTLTSNHILKVFDKTHVQRSYSEKHGKRFPPICWLLLLLALLVVLDLRWSPVATPAWVVDSLLAVHLPQSWVATLVHWLAGSVVILGSNLEPPLWPPLEWLFISFDTFTNLGLKPADPVSNTGAVLMLIENLFGYITLGLLISVFASRFARRAA